jgi:dTDP-4-amino-4,6-dideoxygalactose transaminase
MIKFLDLEKINAQYRDALIQKSIDLIDSGWYIHGKMHGLFEKELAAYIGVKYAIGVANGLDALTIIFRSLIELDRLHPGDKVLVPANTYIASVLAISEYGLIPVLVEPDAGTFNLSVNEMKRSLTADVKAVLNVHLYGRVSWSEEFQTFLNDNDIICIEDNAQAIGAKFNGVKTGALGLAAGFSFYPGKNLGCLGDGGAVTTNDPELADMIRIIGNYGSEKKYQNLVKGMNSRLDELQAGYLSVKLPFLDKENQRRRSIARKYISGITNEEVILPNVPINEDEHVWHLFVVRSKKRDELQHYLLENSVQTLIHYPIPPHKQKAYHELNDMSFPVTEKIHEEVLSLPISPVMTNEEVEEVILKINQFNK